MLKTKSFIGLMLAAAVFAGCGQQAQAPAGDQSAEQPAQAPEGETYAWRMAHEEYNGSMQDLYCQEFAQLLNEKSDGRITLEIYPVGQIGDATQQCELLQNGGLEFAIISPGNTGTIVAENQLFSLHFLFGDDWDKTMEVFKSSKALNEMLGDKYLEKKIKVLAYWPEGFMQWTSNKPLHSPEDFKGLKFRTMPSPMIVAAYNAYGANPTPMPYLEVYSGLQLNMIEGQENPISAIEESKFYEVQKYLTEANSNIYVTTTSVNPDFFNGLPEDIKNIVLEAIEDMRPRSLAITEELNGAALEKIQEASDITVVQLTEAERDSFRQAAMAAYDEYKSMVGADGAAILDTLLEEIAEIQK